MDVKVFSYLATAYTHPDKFVVARRIETFCRVDAKLMKEGLFTVSPLSKHFILEYENLPGDWTYWEHYSIELLSVCKQMIVICMDGWKESIGLKAEIELANELNIEIYYVDEQGNWLYPNEAHSS